ncbi:dihydropteroate synthase [Sphingomonas sanguinis]|jgi:dihydropteroate synthase|uniref:dihydropteroate synthase n=1 Tax=Sphingomonas sanguinis TaxID=33051 RepID=A0A7Y7URL2_9SPHN|nr:dihydropteroate synthase [Sphingomonas sanguinis]MBZ6382799.1 dihydropteroate synthase [Sphingomonas sanguinis]NNG48458.1 dihydropteroate synthase [Sphingomonas sanguinis]NNG51810.1 dihydropteroate synthase [Sphingomonas sanguinis]NVP32099.1 dihydropteroate synthase [Sphingomonas sanguinis]
MHLRPVQFVDTPVGLEDGSVARLAGGMQWFAAYEVREGTSRRIVPIARFAQELGGSPRAEALHAAFTTPRTPWVMGQRTLRFDQPQVAAILNVTPDSFSDGGKHIGDPAAAADSGMAMAAMGAAVIDLGGESTRPGAATVWEGDEIARTAPVIERLTKGGALVSIDTRKAAVMEAALAAGAGIVNDVAALLWDDRALEVVAKAGCPVILMHSPDPDKGGHGRVGYGDVVTEVFDWLEARIAAVEAAGVPRSKIMVDPGIGFGKSLADNLALINGLAIFHGLGCPIMLGASRKRMIGALSNEASVDARLGGSLALAIKGAEAGVQLIRVHDVAETVQALHVWRGLRDRALIG